MGINILYPYKMVGRYEDGFEIEVGGNDEGDCIWYLDKYSENHGELVWYSGVCDDYYIDGELIA